MSRGFGIFGLAVALAVSWGSSIAATALRVSNGLEAQWALFALSGIATLLAVGAFYLLRPPRFEAARLDWRGTLLFYVVPWVLLSVWIVATVWGQGYLSPLFELQFVAGETHIDTLYLSSLGNMVVNFGIPSTGVDGLEVVPYHFFSAGFLAIVGSLFGLTAFESFHLVYPVFAMPFFVLFISLVLERLVGGLAGETESTPRAIYLLPLLLVLTIIGIAPQPFRQEIAVGWNSFLISESYLFSLLLFLLSLIFWDWLRQQTPSQIPTQVLSVVLQAIMVFGLGMSKISLAVLVTIGSGYVWLRWARDRRFVAAMAAGSLLGSIAAVWLTHDPGISSGFSFFNFLRDGIGEVYLGWYLLGMYGLLIVALALLSFFPEQWSRKVRELLILVAVVGALPGLLLDIGGGSAFYFSDLQRWLTMLVLGVVLAFRGDRWVHSALAASWPLRLVGLFALLVFGVSAVLNVGYQLDTFMDESRRYSRADEYQELYSAVERMRGIAEESEEPTIAYVLPEVEAYWQNQYRIDARAFVIPAMVGIPVLRGIPPEMELTEEVLYRGYSSYRESGGNFEDRPTDDRGILAEANMRGYERVLLLEESRRKLSVRLLEEDM